MLGPLLCGSELAVMNMRHGSGCRVDCRAVAGLGDFHIIVPRDRQPPLDGIIDMGERLLARVAMR